MLEQLPKFPDKDLLVGFDTSDDACVYKLREDLAVIQTVDFFPPVVDDPWMYGQIAAANALSDVYAMGGDPTLALNILCFPDCLPQKTLGEILDGGYKKVQEAGAIIGGGHSIDDPIPKYGLCVTGFVHPQKIWSNATAREGDLLILTKPVGSGITTTAAKLDKIAGEAFAPSLTCMAALNKPAKEAGLAVAVSACTDITGFGLLGHAGEMARGSGKTIELYAGEVPLLPHALALAEQGIVPGGAGRNRAYMGGQVSFGGGVAPALQEVFWDPQTSGGLLLAVAEQNAKELLARLGESCPQAKIVGQVLAKEDALIRVV